MIYLLYGPDTYRSRKKLNEIIGEYKKRAGDGLNFYRLDALESTVAAVRNILESGSLFGGKKLVVIDNALSNPDIISFFKKEGRDYKEENSTFILLWDSENTKKAEELKTVCSKMQEFESLKPAQIKQWITEEAKTRGVRLLPRDVVYLTSLGTDLWKVSNELDKLLLTNQDKNLDETSRPSVFDLGDSFFSSKIRALHHLLELLQNGHDEFNLFAYLSGHARTLLTLKFFHEERQPVPANVGIHPFVIKKTSPIIRELSLGSLRNLHHRFFEEDVKIKTGMTKPGEALISFLVSRDK